MAIIINRVWAMPNKWTFEIEPIKDLLTKYVGDGKGWIDPFAGKSVIAEYRNNINESKIDAITYLKSLRILEVNGVLLDPPYSYRQLFKTYKNGSNNLKGKLVPMTEINNIVAPLIGTKGFCISFGWNSNGLGMKRGFEIIEVLLIAHGGHHNDTIVTVERRKNKNLYDACEEDDDLCFDTSPLPEDALNTPIARQSDIPRT